MHASDRHDIGGNGYSVLKEFLFSSQPVLEENTGS